MPVEGLRTVAKVQNGVGAFVLQCKRLDFHYCDFAGSSRGMNTFIKSHLGEFARKNPQIEVTVSPRPGLHPVVRGCYMNGREKVVCVRNMQANEIIQKVLLLRNANGEILKRTKKPVQSVNESVRGIWDPYHGDQHKI